MYRFGIWYKNDYICIYRYIMSKETLEISVLVDEKFDVQFNLVQGFFGFILRIFGK